jgi:capsular exopolysaccharide synthesis family protein
LKLPIALLGVVPKVSAGPSLFPENGDFAPLEQFRTIARRVRVAIDKKGARILIVSAQHGEGRSVVAANLASCYGRQDERVLVVDAQLRPVTGQHDLRGLIAEAEGPVTGLGEYLSFKVEKPSEVIWPTFLPGVACLPRVGTETVPDLLGSNRMRELFAEASAQYGLILVEVPPLLRYADAEALASCADAVLFVVRASTCRSAVLRKALDRLTASKVPVIGAILNGVDALYLEHK